MPWRHRNLVIETIEILHQKRYWSLLCQMAYRFQIHYFNYFVLSFSWPELWKFQMLLWCSIWDSEQFVLTKQDLGRIQFRSYLRIQRTFDFEKYSPEFPTKKYSYSKSNYQRFSVELEDVVSQNKATIFNTSYWESNIDVC